MAAGLWWVLAGWLGGATARAAPPAAAAPRPLVERTVAEDLALEQLLTRLGLDTLRVAHLERALQAAGAGGQQLVLARRLADLYARNLIEYSSDKQRYDQTVQRVTDLLQRFPDAETISLEVMLHQADYNRAETLIGNWIGDPDLSAARDEAAAILRRIAPKLDKRQQDLHQQIERELDELDTLSDKNQVQQQERELNALQVIAGRATYFAAWSAYYQALVTGEPLKAPGYQRAREIFRELLGLGEPVDETTDPEWMGLDSIWRARAVVGLGLAEAACDDAAARDATFALLEHAGVPAVIKQQAPYWQLRAMLSADDQRRALDLARTQVSQMRPPANQGQVSFCVALVRHGFGPLSSNASRADARELGRLGLTGLARLDQLKAIDQLIEKYSIETTSGSGFVLQWARGQRRFGQAESSRNAADYAAAAESLQAALNSPDARSLLGPASRCRYTLGWCLYRQQQFRQAATHFEKAAEGLAAAKDRLAADALWMTYVTYNKLSEKEPRMAVAATNVLRRIQREFPGHAYARRAQYEMTRLQQQHSPGEMLEQLARIAPSDPNYVAAQLDICRLSYEQWKKVRAQKQDATSWLNRLRDAVDRYLALPQTEDRHRQRVQVALMLADAALDHKSPNVSLARQVLKRVEPAVAKLPEDDASSREYHYRQLEWASQSDQPQQRAAESRWLIEHARGTPYELSALLIVANQLDRKIKAQGEAASPQLIRQARQTFGRLVEQLGSSPDQLAESRNARVALARMAEYASRLGEDAEAAAAWDKLVQYAPRNRDYLLHAAVAREQAGQHRRALEHWRILLAGLKRGSDPWFEAKYHQLQCLAHVEPATARKVWKQLQLLYPELGGDKWQARFRDLAGRW